MNEYKK